MSQFNDHRAGHEVFVFPTGTCVKFQHKGFEISLAADGRETFVWGDGSVPMYRAEGTSAKAVHDCVSWIDNMDEVK